MTTHRDDTGSVGWADGLIFDGICGRLEVNEKPRDACFSFHIINPFATPFATIHAPAIMRQRHRCSFRDKVTHTYVRDNFYFVTGRTDRLHTYTLQTLAPSFIRSF